MSIAKWSAKAACVAAFAVAAVGCEVVAVDHRRDRPVFVEHRGPPPAVVYAGAVPPPPQPVIVQAAPPVAEQTVVMQQAPPPPIQEVQVAAPGPGLVWIGGYYVARNGGWLWVSGRWDRPPHPGMHWEAHRWERRGDGFHMVVGGWR